MAATKTSRAPSEKAAVRFFRERFRAEGSAERAAAEKAYLKSDLAFHGVGVPHIRAACRDFCTEYPDLDAAALRGIGEALFETRYHDLHSAGIGVLERAAKALGPKDLPWLVELVRRAANWAHVDWLATAVLPVPLAKHAAPAKVLRRWAKDESFWVQRAALLAQLGDLRRGGGDFALFEELSVPLLEEREFFLRKAIGWVLRDVSKKRPELVFGYLQRHGHRASALTRREATKYLPAALKARLEGAANR